MYDSFLQCATMHTEQFMHSQTPQLWISNSIQRPPSFKEVVHSHHEDAISLKKGRPFNLPHSSPPPAPTTYLPNPLNPNPNTKKATQPPNPPQKYPKNIIRHLRRPPKRCSASEVRAATCPNHLIQSSHIPLPCFFDSVRACISNGWDCKAGVINPHADVEPYCDS